MVQAQLAKYSAQLSLWSSIENELDPAGRLTSTFGVTVDPAYVASLTDTDGDGILSAAEIRRGAPAASIAVR